MKKNVRGMGVASIVIVAMIAGGCGSSSDPIAPSGPTTFGPAYMDMVVQEVIVPMVAMLGVVVAVKKGVEEKKAMQTKAFECYPQEGMCTSGSAEFCYDSEAGIEEYRFHNCGIEGEIMNGTITMAFLGGVTVTFDLTIGSGGLYGSISAEYIDDCIREYIDGLMVTAPGVSTTMDGTLDYCYADPYPAGNLEMTLTDTNVGILLFDMQFHGNRYVDVEVYEMPGEDLRADCQVDMAAESATCDYME